MNVAIVGNSNCVFREGFSGGVTRAARQMGGSVRNYSLGGSCCALHIYTFHDKYEELASSDLVILDSLVIDTFHWRRGIIRQDELVSLIDDMYALYAGLPANIVSVLFPIKGFIDSHEQLVTYRAHISSARKYGVDIVDLYKVVKQHGGDTDPLFMQPSHLKTEIAEEIGFRLAKGCQKGIEQKDTVSSCESPYQVVSNELFSGLESQRVESSLLGVTCFKLDKELRMGSLAGKHLVGALHWNKTCHSRIAVSCEHGQDVVEFRSQYAFFEVLNVKRKIDEWSLVRPAGAEEELTQMVAGKVREAGYGYPHLIGLLVKSDADVHAPVVNTHGDISSMVSGVFG